MHADLQQVIKERRIAIKEETEKYSRMEIDLANNINDKSLQAHNERRKFYLV